MALLTTQTISQAGIQPALQAASSGGDQYQPGANVFLLVKNGDSVQHTLTVHTTATVYGQPISNIAIPLPSGSETYCGPYDPGEVAQPGSTLANLTYDAVTNVTIAVIACPSA